jgi:hypothetical protein
METKKMHERRAPTGNVRDFDFLYGEWKVASRRLKRRFADSGDWDRFEGYQRVAPYLGGVANVDEIVFPAKGFSGMTVRLFDTERRQWSIYWASSRTGVLGAPVHGGFVGDTGIFFGVDDDDGVPVDVEFKWEVLGRDRARWSQAFSRDGSLWETNWVMEFERADVPAEKPARRVRAMAD